MNYVNCITTTIENDVRKAALQAYHGQKRTTHGYASNELMGIKAQDMVATLTYASCDSLQAG